MYILGSIHVPITFQLNSLTTSVVRILCTFNTVYASTGQLSYLRSSNNLLWSAILVIKIVQFFFSRKICTIYYEVTTNHKSTWFHLSLWKSTSMRAPLAELHRSHLTIFNFCVIIHTMLHHLHNPQYPDGWYFIVSLLVYKPKYKINFHHLGFLDIHSFKKYS